MADPWLRRELLSNAVPQLLFHIDNFVKGRKTFAKVRKGRPNIRVSMFRAYPFMRTPFLFAVFLAANSFCFLPCAQILASTEPNSIPIPCPPPKDPNHITEAEGKLILQTLAADVRSYEQHPELWSGSNLVFVARGYASETNFGQAMAVYKKLLVVQPNNTEAIRGVGVCYLLTQKIEPAVVQFKQGWALGDDLSLLELANLYGYTTRQYKELGQLAADLLKARERMTEVEKKHEIVDVLMWYSLHATPSGDKALFLKAIDGVSDEFILGRDDTANIALLGFETFGFQDRANQLGKKRADQEAKEAQLLFEVGNAEYESGSFTAAIADFSKAIELAPTNAMFYFKRGLVEHDLEKYQAAVIDYSKAIELDPKLWPAYDNRGSVEFLRGNPDSAIADYSKSIELNPASFHSYLSLGLIQDNQHQWQSALKNLRKSLQPGPGQDLSQLYIWLVRARLGEQEDASKELDAYLQSRPMTKANIWSITVGEFLLGTRTEDGLLKAANANASAQEVLLCEAYYFMGMKHLLAGDEKGAADRFKKSVDTKAAKIFEYHNAEAELRALKE
jgi:tetratricopeptide (TPR) repeat protein